MNRDEIFYWAQKTRKIRYENKNREDFKYPPDFNEEIFLELLERMNITRADTYENLLSNLGLGENEKGFKINNAGIMFFAKKRDLYVRQVYVTCVLYKGTEKVKIIDRKDFRDGLVQDYENAFKFLQQHLRLEYVIEGGGPRKEIPEIPLEALKEALLNAIIHRDYFEIGARVMVEIFDDRVEISNPGELLFEKEKFGRKSVARNPIIFDIFNRLKLVEKVGTGIKRIISSIEKQHLRVDFDIDSFFTIIFYRPSPGAIHDRVTQQVPSKYPASTQQVPSKYPASDSQVSGESIDISGIQEDILLFCQVAKKRNELQEKFQFKDREYFRSTLLKPLIEKELIELLIPDKPQSPKQKYITSEKGLKYLKSQKRIT